MGVAATAMVTVEVTPVTDIAVGTVEAIVAVLKLAVTQPTAIVAATQAVIMPEEWVGVLPAAGTAVVASTAVAVVVAVSTAAAVAVSMVVAAPMAADIAKAIE
jgi:hypothetical protein